MRVLTALSSKGGVGKTTTIMALASAAQSLGQRVVIIDTDQNTPVSRWRDAAIANGNWDDSVTVEMHMEFDKIQESVIAHEEGNTADLVLIDPRGGRSEFHNALVQIVDFILIPSRPIKVDADEVISTIKWLGKLSQAGADIPPYKLLFAAIRPEKQLTAEMQVIREALQTSPHLTARMVERAGFMNMQTRGLLGPIIDNLKADSDALVRGQARTYTIALKEACELLNEVDSLIPEAEAA